MHRFWIFPLILAIVGALLPLFVLAESILPIATATANFYPSIYTPSMTPTYLMKEVLEAWQVLFPYTAGMGVIMGIGMALFDWFRNGYLHSENLAPRLISNLWWCGFYMGALVTLDSVFFCLLFSKATLPSQLLFARFLPLLFSAILALSAIFWASIRTITGTDVLTPQLLGAKLRRSTSIQG